MDYKLSKASLKDIDRLIEYKLKSIFDYAVNLNEEEILRINDYVKNEIPIQLSNYKLIKIGNDIIGSLLVEKYKDGYLLDEIYIDKEFRNNGIGTNIIKNILHDKLIVYLWVYKNNEKAIELYFRLGFNIVLETETRYFMKYISN